MVSRSAHETLDAIIGELLASVSSTLSPQSIGDLQGDDQHLSRRDDYGRDSNGTNSLKVGRISGRAGHRLHIVMVGLTSQGVARS